MKIKNISDFKLLPNYDDFDSMLLDYNNIDENDISYLLPDLSKFNDIDSYLQYMEKIDKGEEFIKFIKENKDKKFCVVGDYDCDGICATVILCYALTLCGIQSTYTTPDRFKSGYGMKQSQIDTALRYGIDIIITVDNGITANDAIDYAHENNLKVIVTDHHTPQGENHADLVINPLYNNDKFKKISGATVAMKLAYDLYKEFKFDYSFIENFVALAGITCLSDVMPMLGENRVLLKCIIDYLNSEVYSHGSFINRLAKMINFYDPKCSSDPYFELPGTFRDFTKDNIDFYFVPIVNVVNRVIGNVDDLVYDIMTLFTSDFSGVSSFYSDINTKRKYMKTELLSLHHKNNKNAVVEVLNPGKYEDNYSGIAGLVSSSIVENENKPALIGIYLEDSTVHFSGRSVSGFNLYDALDKIKKEHPELKFNFGGHAEALGATIDINDVSKLEDYLSEEFSKVNLEEVEQIAIEVNKDNLEKLLSLYKKYWPFGNKFEFPKLYYEGTPKFINTSNSTFRIGDLDINIKYFSRDIREKVSTIVYKKSSKKLKCLFSIMEENGVLYFKIEKTL